MSDIVAAVTPWKDAPIRALSFHMLTKTLAWTEDVAPVILRGPLLYYFAQWAARKKGGALSLPECRPSNPDASAGMGLPVTPLSASEWQAHLRARKHGSILYGSVLFVDSDASCAAPKEVATRRQVQQGGEAHPKAWELALKQRPKKKGDFSADLTKLTQVLDADKT